MPPSSDISVSERAYLVVQLVVSHMLAIGIFLPVFFLNRFLKINPVVSMVFLQVPITLLWVGNVMYFAFLLSLRFTRRVNLLEVVYLSTNPGKIARRGAYSESLSQSLYFQFITTVPEAVFNTFRNALWINVTAVSTFSYILPVPICTRAATIIKAVNVRAASERTLGFRKGPVRISIAKEHRLVEENIENVLPRRLRWRKDKYWKYWNDLSYEPRHFIQQHGSRVALGRLRAARPGEYTNSLGENKGFHLDTGDLVIMTEGAGCESTISFLSSSGVRVQIRLTCTGANNLVHWIWQQSIDTIYGALEGREAPSVDKNTWELDVGLFIFGTALRVLFYYHFGIIDDQTKQGASDPVSIALLHLSIVAVVYTIRQAFLKDWIKYRGKLVDSELCYLTIPQRGNNRLGRLLRTIMDMEDDEEDRGRVAPVFIGDANQDLFLNETWGIDCTNPEQCQEQRLSIAEATMTSTQPN